MQNTGQNKHTNRELLVVDNLLRVDSKAGVHGVTIPYSAVYNFMEDPTLTGSCRVVFNVNEWGSYDQFKLIGNYQLGSTKGWAIGIGKPSAGAFANKVYFLNANASAYNYIAATSPHKTGYLCDLVVVKTVMSIAFYINGLPLGSTTTTGPGISASYSTTQPITVAATEQFEASQYNDVVAHIAQISLFNKALSAAEVINLHSEIGIIPKDLHSTCVGYWTAQEKNGTKLYDLSTQFNYAKTQHVTNPTIDTDITGYADESSGGTNHVLVWSAGKAVLTTDNCSFTRMTVGTNANATIPITRVGYYELRFKARASRNGVTNTQTQLRIHSFGDFFFNYDEDVIYRFNLTYPNLDIFLGVPDGAATSARIEVDYCYLYRGAAPITANNADLTNYSSQELTTNRIDYYSKTATPFLGLKCGTGTSIDFTSSVATKYSGKQNLTYYFDFTPTVAGDFLFAPGFNGSNPAIRIGANYIIINCINLTDSSNVNYVLLKASDNSIQLLNVNKRNKLYIQYRQNQKLEAWLNGIKLSTDVRRGTDGLSGLYTGNFSYGMSHASDVIMANISSGGSNSAGATINEFCSIDTSTLTDAQKAALTTVDIPNSYLLDSQTKIQHIQPANAVGTTVYDLAPSPINGTKVGFVGVTDNIDIKSNLPELKNYVLAGRTGAEFLIRAPVETSVKSIGTGDMSYHISVFVGSTSGGTGDDRIAYFRGNGWSVYIYKHFFQIAQTIGGTQYFLVANYPEFPGFISGAHTFTLIRHSTNRYRAFMNGRELVFISSGGGGTGIHDSFGGSSVPYGTAAPWDFNSSTTELQYLVFPNYNNYIINMGIRTGVQSIEEHMYLHNNGLFNNPRSLYRHKCYYQFDRANTATYTATWSDLTGLQTGAYADQILTTGTINSLR